MDKELQCSNSNHSSHDGLDHSPADCGTADHFNCDGKDHSPADCGIEGHYNCDGLDHNNCDICGEPLCNGEDHTHKIDNN